MKKIIGLFTAILLVVGVFTGCAGENSSTVSTNGSTSMEKVIGALGEAFMEQNSGANFTYDPTGSGTGIGIDPEYHARFFERFYRVDKSHSKASGGTGLGLSIVKHAVQYHGGKISIESTLGHGTTMKVQL